MKFPRKQQLDEHQKIPVLLAEYNTLRAEVLAARQNIAQAITVTAAVLMSVLAFGFSSTSRAPEWAPETVAATAVVYLLSTILWNQINTRHFTRRLRVLEREINRRAGERLLVWETDSGWGGLLSRNRVRDLKQTRD